MNLMIVPGMFVCSSFLINVCMFIVSKALLISSATVIVNDVCMCVVNKQFELLEFDFDSVYVDLQYNEIYLTSTAGSVSL